MKESEYNNLLLDISKYAFSINQLIYEIIVIITIYYFLTSSKAHLNITKDNKSILILYAIFAVMLDWFIWNNYIQTTLFIAILVIYINYSFTNLNIISTFINLTESQFLDSNYVDNNQLTNCNEPAKIPELVSLPYDISTLVNNTINAYDSKDSTKELNEVYKPNNPYLTIVDSNYAKVMLDELYKTPQYKFANDAASNDGAYGNLNKFRNPEKVFLDSSWLEAKGQYNDNCISSSCSNSRSSSSSSSIYKSNGKDAICNVVQFGKKLEQCTNQKDSITQKQLESISSNEIPTMEF